jgi:hypothetical protein
MDADLAHRFLRETVLEAARVAAPGIYPGARKSLTDGDTPMVKGRRRKR